MAATLTAAFITPIVNACITPIIEPLFQHLGYLFRPGASVTNLERARQELNRRKGELHEEIVRAGTQSDEIGPSDKADEWMEEVRILEDEKIAMIVEDYKRPKAFLTACNCWLRYKIGQRAANAVQDAEELTRREFPVTEKHPPVVRMKTTLAEVTSVSTKKYLEEAIDYIKRDDVRMVGIWGMGGVGKTTLLHMVNNDPSIVAAGFDFVILQVVSQDLNLERLRKDIAERVHAGDAMLYHYLKDKSFLLLLDDIWESFDLTNGVGIPLPQEGVTPKRKIVFTTRSEAVCANMEALLQVRCNKIKINCLQREEAWELFLRNVGDGMRSIIDSDPRVQDCAQKIADKCGGLPLALGVIARAMSANKTWREWENAVNQINTIGIQGINRANPFLPLLKVSYDRLPDDCTKNCFLSCALWPEDLKIQVHELIYCWWGMNLVDYCDDYNMIYNSGYAIVQRLKRACLLEQVEDFYDVVKMHDIIREMALWIVSSSQRKWMVKNRYNLKHGSDDAEQWREAEIICLSYGRAGVLPQHPACPNLSSLMLSDNFRTMRAIPEGFFQDMPVLTFLDLSNTDIRELPPAIGRMHQLQHLNLSHTEIESLPVELENLAELKVLLVGWTDNFVMPQGLLSKFSKLGHLGVSDMDVEDFMEELVSSTITSLDCRLGRIETMEGLAKNNASISLRFLQIYDLRGVKTLSLSSLLRIGNTRSTLSSLDIYSCDELENITISNQCKEEVFHNLEYFQLSNMRVLKKITSSAGSLLRNVRFVEISWCMELRSATWILHCPRIETLEIRNCSGMEHVIGNKEGAEDGSGDEIEALAGGEIEQSDNSMVFSHLISLVLDDLPMLRSFSTGEIGFPSLKKVQIISCPLLDETPFSHLKITRDESGDEDEDESGDEDESVVS